MIVNCKKIALIPTLLNTIIIMIIIIIIIIIIIMIIITTTTTTIIIIKYVLLLFSYHSYVIHTLQVIDHKYSQTSLIWTQEGLS